MEDNEIKIPVKKNNKAFMICFIIGCVFAAVAIILNMICSVMLFGAIEALSAPSEAGEALGAAFSIIIVIIIAIPSILASIVSMVLCGLGIKWNKIAGIIMLVVIALSLILMCTALITFIGIGNASAAESVMFAPLYIRI